MRMFLLIELVACCLLALSGIHIMTMTGMIVFESSLVIFAFFVNPFFVLIVLLMPSLCVRPANFFVIIVRVIAFMAIGLVMEN